MKDKMTIIGLILGIIFIAFLSPLLWFCLCWVTGWLIKILFGATFIKGLTFLHIHITLDQIPLFCGVLGIIGSFFKSSKIEREKDQ